MQFFIKRFLKFLMLLLFAYLLIVFSITNNDMLKKLFTRVRNNINAEKVTGMVTNLGTVLRYDEMDNYQDVDVLIVGSSVSIRSFDTRIFQSNNVSAFTLAHGGQTPVNSYYLLQKYLDQINPKTIILECYWNPLFELSSIEATVGLMGILPYSKEIFKMALAGKHIITFNALLVNAFNLKGKSLSEVTDDIGYKPGGFIELTGNWKPKKLKPKYIKVREQNLEYLKKIIDLIKTRNIDVILVVPPVTKELKDSIRNYNEILQQIKTIADSNQLRFYDFNTTVNVDSHDCFFDTHHLNKHGAKIFTEAFIERVIK